jgi:SPP1 gp7 family putative phage head morphogenesis protein
MIGGMEATRDRAETFAERRARKRAETKAEEEFAKAHNAATSYGAALRGYARQIGNIINFHAEGTPPIVPPHKRVELDDALRRYAAGTLPWAKAAAAKMIAEVDRRNLTAWQKHTAALSTGIRRAIATAPVGPAMLGLLAEQVGLITSLPLQAAVRVHENTLGALEAGSRYQEWTAIERGYDPGTETWTRGEPELNTELERALALAHPDATLQWLTNRATLIARTETARTASVLVQARAESVGAESYIWKTAGDWKVRPSHKRLNEHEFRWDEPPLSDPPDHRSHPGQIWNCRCVALPIISE